MATRFDLLLYGSQVLTPSGIQPAQVGIRHDRIAAISPMQHAYADLGTDAVRVYSLGKHEVLIPGLINLGAHVVDFAPVGTVNPERATRAAMTGGVTTVLDAPSQSDSPTTTAAELRRKQDLIQTHVHTDVGLLAGPEIASDQLGALRDAGNYGIEVHDEDQLEELLPRLGQERTNQPVILSPGPDHRVNVLRVLQLAQQHQAPVHLSGISATEDLALLRQAKNDGVALTASVAVDSLVPHDPLGTHRNGVQDEARSPFWEALGDGVLSGITPGPADRTGSLQLWLSLVWTEAWRRGFMLADVMKWLSANPADVAGLQRKGRIAVGYDADVVVFSPQHDRTITSEEFVLPSLDEQYVGTRLLGSVSAVYLRGHHFDPLVPKGVLLHRNEETPPTPVGGPDADSLVPEN